VGGRGREERQQSRLQAFEAGFKLPVETIGATLKQFPICRQKKSKSL
jgi:hypothetical protein